jgi:hypothetical protein
MFSFSKEAEEGLRAAGWFPGRCVDITEYEHAFSLQGYVLTEPIRAAFREFADLELEFPSHVNPSIKINANFYLMQAIEDMPIGWVRFLERLMNGEKLVPIGLWNGYFRNQISESGKIYSYYDAFWYYDDSIQGFIEGLYHRGKHPVVEIPIPDESWKFLEF